MLARHRRVRERQLALRVLADPQHADLLAKLGGTRPVAARMNRLLDIQQRLLETARGEVLAGTIEKGIDERLEEGSLATLHFTPPEGRPVDVQAMVWRSDDDGPVFFFMKTIAKSQ